MTPFPAPLSILYYFDVSDLATLALHAQCPWSFHASPVGRRLLDRRSIIRKSVRCAAFRLKVCVETSSLLDPLIGRGECVLSAVPYQSTCT